MIIPDGGKFTPTSRDEVWSLIGCFADFYWQEDTHFQCTAMRVSKAMQGRDNPLAALEGSTLWDIGCLVTGRGQSWRAHLTDRKLQRDFKELICRLPHATPESGAIYISISGKARFTE